MIIPNLAIHLQSAEERKALPALVSGCLRRRGAWYRLKVQEKGSGSGDHHGRRG